jgi:hypothetical protein
MQHGLRHSQSLADKEAEEVKAAKKVEEEGSREVRRERYGAHAHSDFPPLRLARHAKWRMPGHFAVGYVMPPRSGAKAAELWSSARCLPRCARIVEKPP